MRPGDLRQFVDYPVGVAIAHGRTHPYAGRAFIVVKLEKATGWATILVDGVFRDFLISTLENASRKVGCEIR